MSIILRSYQEPFYNNIIEKLNYVNSLLCVLPTGGGKSVIIGKLANNLKGRTLILTHREEIFEQNSDWINNVGLLSSKIDTVRFDSDTIICMVQTLFSRIKNYGLDYLGEFDNIILDECHILIFEKVFEKYNYKKLIGFTATPVTNKKIYTTIDDIDFVEPYTLDKIFEDIVIGPSTQELIDLGNLCQEHNIVLKLPDFDKLKESTNDPDGYTKKSLNQVYSNTASLNILTGAYNEICKGKKTLIFNPSTKINKFVYDHFKLLNINVKMFDSQNKSEINPKTNKKFTRKEIIDWFKEERDAVLIGTNVFTTGFNVTDVEVVVVNRATKSLSLWHQMVGRGSRTTDKIYKNHFTVIDLGQNIFNHGIWSKDINWMQYFKSPGKKRKNKIDLLSTWDCLECESINLKGDIICEYCGEPKSIIKVDGKTKKLKEGILEELEKTPPPKAKSIISYTLAKGENSTFAFKLLSNKIIDLFITHKVSKEFYNKRIDDFIDKNGFPKEGFKTRVKKIFLPIYFAIIKNEELKKLPSGNKTIEKELERIYNKINKIYGQ